MVLISAIIRFKITTNLFIHKVHIVNNFKYKLFKNTYKLTTKKPYIQSKVKFILYIKN